MEPPLAVARLTLTSDCPYTMIQLTRYFASGLLHRMDINVGKCLPVVIGILKYNAPLLLNSVANQAEGEIDQRVDRPALPVGIVGRQADKRVGSASLKRASGFNKSQPDSRVPERGRTGKRWSRRPPGPRSIVGPPSQFPSRIIRRLIAGPAGAG